jgi:WD40 repeat protein
VINDKQAHDLQDRVKKLETDIAKRDYLHAMADAERQFNDRVRLSRTPEKLTLPHSHDVLCLAFAPDGKTLATGGENGQIRLWEILTREGNTAPSAAQSHSRGWIAATSADVRSLAFSQDGRTLATGDADGKVRVIGMPSHRVVRIVGGNQGPISGIAFSPDNRVMATAGKDQGVHLWDVITGKELLAADGQITAGGSVAFTPDGKQLAIAGSDSTVRLWDTSTGREVRQLATNVGKALNLALSPDGKQIVAALADGSVRVLDATTGRIREEIQKTDASAGIVFSPDGKTLAAGGEQGAVHLYDAASGKEIRHINADGPVTALTFSPNGGVLAVATKPRTVTLWPMQQAKPQSTNAPIRLGLRVDHDERRDTHLVSLDGTRIKRADLEGGLRQLVQNKRTELLLEVGDDVPYTEVKEVLDVAERAGIKRVQFTTLKQSGTGSVQSH